MVSEFSKQEQKKVKTISNIIDLIKNNEKILAEFNIEIKVFQKGKELSKH